MNYQKVTTISTKGLIKDLINGYKILNGVKYFSLGIFQNYLVFIPATKYVKYLSGTLWIDSWKSNGMSEENIEDFEPIFVDHHVLPNINFNRHCLINNNISIPKKVTNMYIYILHTKLMAKKFKHRFYI